MFWNFCLHLWLIKKCRSRLVHNFQFVLWFINSDLWLCSLILKCCFRLFSRGSFPKLLTIFLECFFYGRRCIPLWLHHRIIKILGSILSFLRLSSNNGGILIRRIGLFFVIIFYTLILINFVLFYLVRNKIDLFGR